MNNNNNRNMANCKTYTVWVWNTEQFKL